MVDVFICVYFHTYEYCIGDVYILIGILMSAELTELRGYFCQGLFDMYWGEWCFYRVLLAYSTDLSLYFVKCVVVGVFVSFFMQTNDIESVM